MECILQEKKEADSTYRLAIEEARRSIDNLNKDLKHYSDLYQTCENNCNTICKEKLKNVTGKFFRFNFTNIEKLNTQVSSINKAQQVIQKLNEENKNLAEQIETLTSRIEELQDSTKNYDKLRKQLKEAEKDIDWLQKQLKLHKGTHILY